MSDAARLLRGPSSIAGGVVLAQGALYAAIALPGSFYLDDLASTNRAAASHMTWSYLRGPAGHHLAPGTMLWLWLQAHVMPFDHTAAVLLTLALQAFVTVMLWRLLRQLFGDRRLLAVPLAVYALSPLTMPTFAWWSQSICQLPVHLAIVGATAQHLRYVRSRRLRHAALAGAWVLFGLMFWEKAALAVAVPVLLTLVALTSGPVLARARAMVRLWPAWVALLVPTAGGAAFYSGTQRQGARSVGDVLRLLGDSTTHFVLPSLVGGPWRWTRSEFYGIANPAMWQLVLADVVVAVAVVVTVARRREALRGWLLLALYVPVSLAPVALGRLAPFAVDAGRDSRYVSDIALVAGIAVALVLMPVVGLPDPTAPSARALRTARPVRFAVAGLVTASALVSHQAFADRWHQNPTGDYLARLESQLPDKGSANLYDGQLPSDVLGPLYTPRSTVSALLAQLPGRARFQDGMVPQSVVLPDGSVRLSAIAAVATTVPGPLRDCGYAVTADHPSAQVPLTSPVPAFVDRTVRVELLLSAPTRVSVETTDGLRVSDDRELPRGAAAVVGLVPGGTVSGFVVSGLSPGASACVLKATVGTPRPL